ncbi:MAG: hypothetical protein QF436_02340 [Candidatus Woesearchaeota archaeon]|jgi:hypothetical protein|nr:hypothetical protein [Candidatus Woesearchaeota archaeon]MDP7622931.1 hypothetical protein [Candidatus Woesearchaeota archaeon]HJN57201.1 hypothetical protein [Candidatus Woesearchaeota archaeon]|tara:strand:- start:22185 stop:23546 length:1362 start_codon:yes stop_codon:yes gene_type:complete
MANETKIIRNDGKLLSKFYPNGFSPTTLLSKLDNNELYFVYKHDNIDPYYLLLKYNPKNDEKIEISYGPTGYPRRIDKRIFNGNDNKLKLENIILRHEQNNFSVNKELLPVDNVPFNESLDAGQLTGLLIDYSLELVQKHNINDEEHDIFKFLSSHNIMARFKDYSQLIHSNAIVPDLSDILTVVNVSDGCGNDCRHCPEGGNLKLYSKEDIRSEMIKVLQLHIKYHPNTIRKMTEGFLNTSDILWYEIQKSQIKPDEIAKMFFEYFPWTQKLGTFFGVKNLLNVSKDSNFGNIITGNYLKSLYGAGINRGYVGIESGNSKVSAILRKNETYGDKLKALDLLKGSGIKTKAIVLVGVGESYITGDDEEIKSIDAMQDTIKLLENTSPYRVMISRYLPNENLPLEKLRKEGQLKDYKDKNGIQKEIDMLTKAMNWKNITVEQDYESFVVGKARK